MTDKHGETGLKFNKDFALKSYTTTGFSAECAYFVRVSNKFDLPAVMQFCDENKLKFMVIGDGSNIVLGSEYINRVMIRLSFSEIEITEKTESYVIVRSQAGADWNAFVNFTIEEEFWGLENLVLIPGTVGAAPVQNIGAFGQDVAAVIDSVHVYDTLTNTFKDISNNDCGFSYRSSIFNKEGPVSRYIICSVDFKLSLDPRPILARREFANLRNASRDSDLQNAIRETVIKYRTNRINLPDDRVYGSAGTFFRTAIIRSNKEYLSVLVKTLFNVGLVAAAAIVFFSYKYRNSEGFKIPSKLLIKFCGLASTSAGSVALLKTNPAVLVTDRNENPSVKDLNFVISEVIINVERKTGVEIPIEPIVLV